MTKIFEEKVNWYRSPIDKTVKKELMKRSDLHGFLQIIPQLLLSVVTGAFCIYAFYTFSWPIVLLAFFIHGTCVTFVGEHAAIHELSYGTVFKTKWINEFFLIFCGFITWKNVVMYRASHTRHHMATVYTKQDLEIPMPYKVPLWKWIGFYTFDFDRFNVSSGMIVRHSCGILKGDWENYLFPTSDTKARKKLFGFARKVLIGQLLIVVAIIYFKLWILLAIFTFPFYATC